MNWTNEKPKCGTCRFYDKDWAECRAHAPVCVGFGNGFPNIADNLWCAEWQAIPDPNAKPNIPKPTEAAQPHYIDPAVRLDGNERLK